MRKLLLVTVAALSILTIGCGKSDKASSSSSTTVAPSSTSTTAASSSTTSNPSSHTCSTTHLTGRLGPSSGGAGQHYQALTLTNTGTTSCDLRGFPGVSLLGSDGKQVGQPATREGAEGSTVVLAPGGSATSVLHTTAEGIGPTCITGASVLVYPPDSTTTITISGTYTACGGFSVSTLVAGLGDN